MKILKGRSKYDWIAWSCYIFMVAVMLGEGYWNHARAGDVQWNIQWHWQVPAPTHNHYLGCPHWPHSDGMSPDHSHNVPCVHNCTIGSAGPSTTTYTDAHNHQHYFYGFHVHKGVTYPVEYEFRNYRGQMCKEFQMTIQFMFGPPERAWATVCQGRDRLWRLQQ